VVSCSILHHAGLEDCEMKIWLEFEGMLHCKLNGSFDKILNVLEVHVRMILFTILYLH